MSARHRTGSGNRRACSLRPASLSPTAFSAQISLAAGWNLIALPLIPEDSRVDTVFAPIAGQFDLVYVYDACDSADPLEEVRTPMRPAFANDLAQIGPQNGLWVRTVAPTALTIVGKPARTVQQTLCPGWNLISYPRPRAPNPHRWRSQA